MPYKSFDKINEKIRQKKAVVVTAEEILGIVDEKGVSEAAKEVDVVTTVLRAMSVGAFSNFGHSDPPFKMARSG